MCKSVWFSNVGIAKDFNFVSYCSATCTEHPVNVISSSVKKFVVSYKTSCPVNFDIAVQTVDVTHLCTYHCVCLSKYVTALLPLSCPFCNFDSIHQSYLQHSQFAHHHNHPHQPLVSRTTFSRILLLLPPPSASSSQTDLFIPSPPLASLPILVSTPRYDQHYHNCYHHHQLSS